MMTRCIFLDFCFYLEGIFKFWLYCNSIIPKSEAGSVETLLVIGRLSEVELVAKPVPFLNKRGVIYVESHSCEN